jgi:hypothetical protein
MNNITQGEKRICDNLEINPDYEAQCNNKNYVNENSATHHEEELRFEFLVQDMFLDHFFP